MPPEMPRHLVVMPTRLSAGRSRERLRRDPRSPPCWSSALRTVILSAARRYWSRTSGAPRALTRGHIRGPPLASSPPFSITQGSTLRLAGLSSSPANPETLLTQLVEYGSPPAGERTLRGEQAQLAPYHGRINAVRDSTNGVARSRTSSNKQRKPRSNVVSPSSRTPSATHRSTMPSGRRRCHATAARLATAFSARTTRDRHDLLVRSPTAGHSTITSGESRGHATTSGSPHRRGRLHPTANSALLSRHATLTTTGRLVAALHQMERCPP